MAHSARHGDIGYVSLWVQDIGKATDFFHHVLAWEVEHDQVIGQSIPMGFVQSLTMHGGNFALAVADLEGARARLTERGGTTGEIKTAAFGQVSECVDDQGMAFTLYTPVDGVCTDGEGPPKIGELHGDISYITLHTPHSTLLRNLLTEVGGWAFTPGTVEDGWHAADVAPMTGIVGGRNPPQLKPMYRVDDIEAAVIRVREAGGSAVEVTHHAYGLTSDCSDNQGTRFWLGQH